MFVATGVRTDLRAVLELSIELFRLVASQTLLLARLRLSFSKTGTGRQLMHTYARGRVINNSFCLAANRLLSPLLGVNEDANKGHNLCKLCVLNL